MKAVISAAVSAAVAYVVSGFNPGVAAAVFAVSFVVGGASELLGQKPKSPSASDSSPGGIQTSSRAAAAPRRAAYGLCVASGQILLEEPAGSGNAFLEDVAEICAHAIDGVIGFFINEDFIALADLDGSGNCVAGKYSGYLRFQWKQGTETQTAFADLTAEFPSWTAAHRARGRFVAWLRPRWNTGLYTGGAPDFRILFRARQVWDPRAATIDILSSTAASPAVFETDGAHGLAVGQRIFVVGHEGAILERGVDEPARPVEGEHYVTSVPTSTTFRCAKAETLADVALEEGGTGGTLSVMIWSTTPTLCQADYFLSRFGMKGTLAEVDVDEMIADANICDELVTCDNVHQATADASSNVITLAEAAGWQTGTELQARSSGTLFAPVMAGTSYWWIRLTPTTGKLAASQADAGAGTAIDLTTAGSGTHTLYRGTTFTADASSNILTPAKFVALPMEEVKVYSTGTPPGGLTADTAYYAITAGPRAIKLAASVADARAGTAIDLSSAGTGTHTIVRTRQPRYSMSGSVEFGRQHGDIMKDMMTASAGACVFVQGKHIFRCGAYRAPAENAYFNEASLRDAPSFEPQTSRSEIFNTVKAIHLNYADNFAETDAPPVSNAALIAADGEELSEDLRLPLTPDPFMAQRIMQIFLKKARQEIKGRLPCNEAPFGVAVTDTIALSYAKIGFVEKVFLVSLWGQPGHVGHDMEIIEESADNYVWTGNDATWVDPAPNTSLTTPLVCQPPTAVALTSGTAALDRRVDGTIFSRIRVDWTAADDQFVIEGGAYVIQTKKSDDPDVPTSWRPSAGASGSDVRAWILDVADGEQWDVEIWAVNSIGIPSEPVRIEDHTVIGKTERPSDVVAFSAAQNGALVNFRCNPVGDADLKLVAIKRVAQGGSDWDAAVPVANMLRGESLTSGAVPPGAWTFLARAEDTSGNLSNAIATYDLTVTNANTMIGDTGADEAPDWLGVKSNFVKHWTGVLVPQDQNLASVYGWEVFDQFVPTPYALCTYDAPEIDVGQDGSFRTYGPMAATLGAGETTGAPNPTLSIDYREAAASYDGFEPWTVGQISARYVKQKLSLAPADGNCFVTSFKPTCDAEVRDELFNDLTIDAGGEPIVFSRPFFNVPNVQVTPDGTTARIGQASARTTLGCTAHLFNTSGTDVGGTGDVRATGV